MAMTTRVTKSIGTTITVESTIEIGGPILKAEEAIQVAVNEVGAAATVEARARYVGIADGAKSNWDFLAPHVDEEISISIMRPDMRRRRRTRSLPEGRCGSGKPGWKAAARRQA